jgi:hypothetical protein
MIKVLGYFSAIVVGVFLALLLLQQGLATSNSLANGTVVNMEDRIDLRKLQDVLKETRTLLIHVGKTGGGSTNQMLTRLFKNQHRQIHVQIAKQRDIDDADYVLLNTRDPLARFVSAFKWIKNKNKEKLQLGIHDEETRLFDCFPTLSALGAQCLDEPHSSCVEFLKQGLDVRTAISHWGKGYKFHLQEVALSGIKNLLILRDEFLQSDFDAFLSEVIGWPVHYPTSHNHADYAGNNDSLPVPYHECVKKLLHSEYVLYDLILAEFQKRQRTRVEGGR